MQVNVKLVVGAAIIKGMLMSALLFALGVAFWQQLVIAAVSAVLTGVFVMGSAYMTVKAAKENRAMIEVKTDEIKATVTEAQASNGDQQ